MDMAESQNSLTIEEDDLQVYILAYKSLKDSFRARTRFFVGHIEDDIWEVSLIGLTSREWLEFCATVYAELPSETVKLVQEAQSVKSVMAESPVAVISEQADEPEETPEEDDSDLEDAAAEEEEYEDEDSGEESEEDGTTVNPDGETPADEVQRKLKRAKLVRRTGSPAVTVESD